MSLLLCASALCLAACGSDEMTSSGVGHVRICGQEFVVDFMGVEHVTPDVRSLPLPGPTGIVARFGNDCDHGVTIQYPATAMRITKRATAKDGKLVAFSAEVSKPNFDMTIIRGRTKQVVRVSAPPVPSSSPGA
jgi:hypothetical protein